MTEIKNKIVVLEESGPDMVLQKLTRNKDGEYVPKKQLVLLFSQKKFYQLDVKNNIVNKDSAIIVDEKLFKSFFSSTPELIELKNLERSINKDDIDGFWRFLTETDEQIRDLVKKGFVSMSRDFFDGTINREAILLIKEYKALVSWMAKNINALNGDPKKVFSSGRFNRGLFKTACVIEKTLGGSTARLFLKEFERSPIGSIESEYIVSRMTNKDSEGYRYRYSGEITENWIYFPHVDIKLDWNFDGPKFIEYIIWGATSEGYAKNMREFFTIYSDTLKMQEKVYGKIREKYPKNLASVHQRLSYQNALLIEEYKKEQWSQQYLVSQKLEAKVNGFYFIAPESPSDIIDEGAAQNNCVKSYIQSVCNKECLIMFMRKEKDKSEITLELRMKDGFWRCVQEKRASNRATSAEESETIKKWIDKINKKKED